MYSLPSKERPKPFWVDNEPQEFEIRVHKESTLKPKFYPRDVFMHSTDKSELTNLMSYKLRTKYSFLPNAKPSNLEYHPLQREFIGTQRNQYYPNLARIRDFVNTREAAKRRARG